MGNEGGGYFVGDWAPPAFILAALALLVSVIRFSGATTLQWIALALGLFAAYAAWTFASLLWSPNTGEAWLGAGQTLLYLLAFWVAATSVALGASRQWVLAASALGPAIVAAFTLLVLVPRLENLFDDDRLSGVLSRLAGTVGYHNGEAAFLLVPFWVAVYLAGSRRVNPILRGAVLAGAVLSVNLAVLTQSRGAMVAMAVSFLVFFLLSGQRLRGLLALVPIAAALYVAFPDLNGVYLGSSGGEAQVAALLGLVLPTVWLTAAVAGLYGVCWGFVDRRWSPPDSVVRAAGGIVLVGCIAILVAGGATLTERVGGPAALVQQKWEGFKTNDATGQEKSRYLSASGSGRYALWQVAWEDFATHPVLGVGTQNYEATYYLLRERNLGIVRQPHTGFVGRPQTQTVRQPHTLPLEVLGERGIVGGALFFGLLATCLAAGLWERFRTLGSEGKAQVGALVAAVAYWFAHSSAEWFWQVSAVTLPAIVYLALLASPWRSVEAAPGSSGSLSRWSLRAGSVGVAVLAVAVIAPLYIADYHLERSRTTTDPAEGLGMVKHAQRFNPLDSRLAEREAELAIETGDWDRAEYAYDRATQLNPEHYEPYVSLATFYERRRELEKALFYHQRALALNPLDDDISAHIRQLQHAEPG